MRYLIKRVEIIDPSSSWDQKRVDVLIENGRILAIEKSLAPKKNETIIEGKKLTLIPTLVDIHIESGEPYQVERESFHSLTQAALKGGVGYLAHFPGSHTPIENKSQAIYLQSYNDKSPCQIIPIGSISRDKETNVLTDMMEMNSVGVKAFTNSNLRPISLDILSNAILYTKGFGGKLMIHPEKSELSKNGQVNQGIHSIMTGFKGIPAEAEFIAVREIVDILSYHEASALLLNITSPPSIDVLSQYNRKMKKVWTSTSALHLCLDDSLIVGYDSVYKVNPPLRSLSDKKKLIKAAINGDIDIVYSQHSPRTEEEKNLEFDRADFGAINIQTSFLTTLTALGVEHIRRVVELMSTAPAVYLGIHLNPIEVNQDANFTLLDLGQKTNVTSEWIASCSKNSPFLNQALEGKIIGVAANQKEQFFL